MPFATAALDARAGRRIVAAGIAAALQGAFYWLILRELVQPTPLPVSTPLEVTMLQTTGRHGPAVLPRKARPRGRRDVPRQEVPSRSAVSARQAPPSTGMMQPIGLPPAAQGASHASSDWQQAIQGEVRAEESTPSTRKLEFGFPQPPPPDPAAGAQFGWDYAHTHRVVTLPEGGLIINLTDRCMVVIYVLPIPLCRIGEMPPNGQLFDHIGDRGNDAPGGLP